MNEKSKPNSNDTVIAVQNQTGHFQGLNRFLRKFWAGVWSMAQLNKEKQTALQNWRQACTRTDGAIIATSRAERRLQQFDLWLNSLEPAYRSRYEIPLYFRRAKIESAYRVAKRNHESLDWQEGLFIKRLITLERLKSALTLNKTKP